ncbi:flagellar hook-basal body complex protein FliE [Herbaspirillum frisingense]|uniref:flagellar hook-basal body complex protein FliE n=1 Tax=Herbaspirillum frisingense TaxID=92645 RepID=UPI001602C69A|nr:flagellar hook-basal body complex protein FliE [Herbaspirillum frisingense]QNB08837.1 flagellar hook-basal body complex protein FliE [Herbaspirillum frisingense]
MSVDSIAAVAASQLAEAATTAAPALAPQLQEGFTQMVSRGLDEVNTQLMATQADLQQLATGNVQNLHQVMIRMEEARTSFQLLMQVRNRALEAYQDLMKMPV